MEDLTAASIDDEYTVDPSIRPICTKYCLSMTNIIQVCSNFHWSRVCITRTRPDEIETPSFKQCFLVKVKHNLAWQWLQLLTFDVFPWRDPQNSLEINFHWILGAGEESLYWNLEEKVTFMKTCTKAGPPVQKRKSTRLEPRHEAWPVGQLQG